MLKNTDPLAIDSASSRKGSPNVASKPDSGSSTSKITATTHKPLLDGGFGPSKKPVPAQSSATAIIKRPGPRQAPKRAGLFSCWSGKGLRPEPPRVKSSEIRDQVGAIFDLPNATLHIPSPAKTPVLAANYNSKDSPAPLGSVSKIPEAHKSQSDIPTAAIAQKPVAPIPPIGTPESASHTKIAAVPATLHAPAHTNSRDSPQPANPSYNSADKLATPCKCNRDQVCHLKPKAPENPEKAETRMQSSPGQGHEEESSLIGLRRPPKRTNSEEEDMRRRAGTRPATSTPGSPRDRPRDADVPDQLNELHERMRALTGRMQVLADNTGASRARRLERSNAVWRYKDPARQRKKGTTGTRQTRNEYDPNLQPRPGDILLRNSKRGGVKMVDFIYFDDMNDIQNNDYLLRAKFQYHPSTDQMNLSSKLWRANMVPVLDVNGAIQEEVLHWKFVDNAGHVMERFQDRGPRPPFESSFQAPGI